MNETFYLPIQDGTNWYIYCSNNPLNMIDPTGLTEINAIKSSNKVQFDALEIYGYYLTDKIIEENSFASEMGLANTTLGLFIDDKISKPVLFILGKLIGNVKSNVDRYSEFKTYDLATQSAMKNGYDVNITMTTNVKTFNLNSDVRGPDGVYNRDIGSIGTDYVYSSSVNFTSSWTDSNGKFHSHSYTADASYSIIQTLESSSSEKVGETYKVGEGILGWGGSPPTSFFSKNELDNRPFVNVGSEEW